MITGPFEVLDANLIHQGFRPTEEDANKLRACLQATYPDRKFQVVKLVRKNGRTTYEPITDS